jgi:uncharacterized membrane protein
MAGNLVERIHRTIPALYLAWALPFVLTLAWLFPPWAHPDEPAHMLRIVELAHGELLGHRIGADSAGGVSDPAVFAAEAPVEALKFHPERKVTRPAQMQSALVPWHDTPSEVGFPNTVQYPPMLYLPAAVAVRIGEMIGLRVDRTLYLARAMTALFSVLVSAAGLILAGRTRCVVAVLAMLPMSCELYASVSQDGPMIAFSLFAVGWVDWLIERGRPADGKELAGVAVVLAAVAMARPPYVTLALLPLLGRARLRWAGTAAAGFVVLAVGAWSAAVAARVLVSHGDPSAQAAHLLVHPLQFAVVLAHTLHQNLGGYVVEFVGQLGWLDTALPRWYVLLALGVVAAAFLAACAGTSRRPWLPVLAVTGAAVLVFGIQYFSWTLPGAAIIDGVQGRYFIPLAAFLALGVPTVRRFGPAVRPIALTGVVTLGVMTPIIVIRALVLRYYLGG